jgi:hypothetical protein
LRAGLATSKVEGVIQNPFQYSIKHRMSGASNT